MMDSAHLQVFYIMKNMCDGPEEQIWWVFDDIWGIFFIFLH